MRRIPLLLLLAIGLLFTGLGCRQITTLNKNTSTTRSNRNVTVRAPRNANAVKNINMPVLIPNRPEGEELERTAASFAERYGSFSNTSNYANFESLYAFMTTGFRETTQTYVTAQREKAQPSDSHYGMTTRTTSVDTQEFDDAADSASFLVHTYRRETIGTASNVRGFPQDMTVAMEKEDGVWKVSNAEWR